MSVMKEDFIAQYMSESCPCQHVCICDGESLRRDAQDAWERRIYMYILNRSELIRFNVGGTIFATWRSTVANGSMLESRKEQVALLLGFTHVGEEPSAPFLSPETTDGACERRIDACAKRSRSTIS